MSEEELFEARVKLVIHFVEKIKDITTKIAIECSGEYDTIQLASQGDGDAMIRLQKEGINFKKIDTLNIQRTEEINKMNNVLDELKHHELSEAVEVELISHSESLKPYYT